MRGRLIGRILALLGLVLLVSSAFTWLIGSPAMALGKVVLALLFFALYFATNFGELGKAFSSKGTLYAGVTGASAFLLALILLVLNVLAARSELSWDLTKDRLNTLSEESVRALAALDRDVSLLAFYRAGEPAQEQFELLFRRYGALSPRFSYRFIDPEASPALAKEYGITGEKERVLLLADSGKLQVRIKDASEESLTNALVRATHQVVRTLYFINGHGESTVEDEGPSGLSAMAKRMESEGLKAESLTLGMQEEIPENAAALVLAGPSEELQPGEVEMVRRYLERGGRVLFMLEPMADAGFDDVLALYNLEVGDDLVVDPASRIVGSNEFAPVSLSYNEQTEIGRGFNLQTVFPTARSVVPLYLAESGATARPLVLTMQSAWAETDLDGLKKGEEAKRSNAEKGGPFALAATSTKPLPKREDGPSGETRIVLFGDRDFATNKFSAIQGNGDLFLNSLNWLCEQSDRITIRPRLREASRLFLDAGKQSLLFFIALDLLPISLLALGLTIWMVRRSR